MNILDFWANENYPTSIKYKYLASYGWEVISNEDIVMENDLIVNDEDAHYSESEIFIDTSSILSSKSIWAIGKTYHQFNEDNMINIGRHIYVFRNKRFTQSYQRRKLPLNEWYSKPLPLP